MSKKKNQDKDKKKVHIKFTADSRQVKPNTKPPKNPDIPKNNPDTSKDNKDKK